MTQTKFQPNEIVTTREHEFGIIRDCEQSDDSEHYYVEFLDMTATEVVTSRYRWMLSIDLELSLN